MIWVKRSALTLLSVFSLQPLAFSFDGRITATLTRGGETQTFLYTASTNQLRIERVGTDWPHAINIVSLNSGAVTLLFPHNRTFVRLKSGASHSSAPPGFPAMPPGVGPQTTAIPQPPGGVGPTHLVGMPGPSQFAALSQSPGGLPRGIGPQRGGGPGTPQFPAMQANATLPAVAGIAAMPIMPMPGEQAEFQATTNTMIILGLPCTRYELKQRGETMEIWAADKLLPFRAWLQNQPSRFGPRGIEEQWPEMLTTKGLFPLRAIVKHERGPERLRFEVKSITPDRVADKSLFEPPTGYHELQPLPF